MIEVNVVRELPVNLKSGAINEIYKKGNKLLLHFNEDTVLGNVSELADVTNGNLTEFGTCADECNIAFKNGFKSVDGKVIICGGESLIVQRFLCEDGYSLGVIKPCVKKWGRYELAYDIYGTGDTYKLADKVEEIKFQECSLSGFRYVCLQDKIEMLNSIIESGYLDIDYEGIRVIRFFTDIEECTEDVRLLVDVGCTYAICIKKSSVLDVLSYIWRILSYDRIVHLEDF